MAITESFDIFEDVIADSDRRAAAEFVRSHGHAKIDLPPSSFLATMFARKLHQKAKRHCTTVNFGFFVASFRIVCDVHPGFTDIDDQTRSRLVQAEIGLDLYWRAVSSKQALAHTIAGKQINRQATLLTSPRTDGTILERSPNTIRTDVVNSAVFKSALESFETPAAFKPQTSGGLLMIQRRDGQDAQRLSWLAVARQEGFFDIRADAKATQVLYDMIKDRPVEKASKLLFEFLIARFKPEKDKGAGIRAPINVDSDGQGDVAKGDLASDLVNDLFQEGGFGRLPGGKVLSTPWRPSPWLVQRCGRTEMGWENSQGG